jgi:WD40 repeat protein
MQIVHLAQRRPILNTAYEVRFSPDGQRYLAMVSKEHSTEDYLCTTKDGDCVRVLTNITDGTPCEPFAWTRDSRRWLAMPGYSDSPIEVRELANTIARKLPVPNCLVDCQLWLSSDHGHSVIRKYTSRDDKILRTIDIGLWDLTGQGKSMKRTVRVPDPGEVMDLAVSPDGNSLAWLIHTRQDTRVYEMVRRLLHALPAQQRRDADELWITTIDGSSPRLIGKKAITVTWQPAYGCFGPGWDHEGNVESLAWTQDGARLSFLYDDGLYTVAAR